MNIIRAKRGSTIEVGTEVKAGRKRNVDDDSCVDVPEWWPRDDLVARICSPDDAIAGRFCVSSRAWYPGYMSSRSRH